MSSSSSTSFAGSPPPSPPPSSSKRILIVGAGTAGIGALLGLLDIPEHVRAGWEITVVEKRKDVAGVWLPDPEPVPLPGIPESPLYPLLKTNTPTPTMTFPNLPFPPQTPLFCSHTHVHSYLSSIVTSQNLSSYLRLNTTVTAAAWNDSAQAWDVDFVSGGKKSEGTFDHLVVANGHYAYPKIPTWEGTGEWLEGGEREVLHSLWYRGAEQLRGKTVLVVGFGASGWDIVRHSQEYADEVYHSYDAYAPGTPGKLPAIPGAIWKPRISHFTPSSIVFTDGSTLSSEKVTVFLATGYENLIPFLRDLSYAPIDPKVPVRSLTTNGSYITPIHADLFAADASIPTNRLAVVGLPWYTAVGGTSYIQGLAVGHAIAEEGFLPGLEEIWRELEEKERRVREQGKEPTKIGHNFINPGDAEAYQDSLLLSIRSRSSIALPSWLSDPNTPYIEDWRRYWRANGVKLGITYAKAVESGLGGEKRFTSETGTQEDWVRAMEELERWGEENVWNQ